MGRSSRGLCCVISLLLLSSASAAWAQGGRQGRVEITVADTTGGVLPGATVTLTGLEANQGVTAGPATASDKGIAVLEGVTPGRYSIRAEFPGFDAGVIATAQIRAGDNRQTITLQLPKLESAVTVGRDAQESAADRRTTEFGASASQDQIDALSEDPAELERQLKELGGSEAVIRIDNFEGQQLPPKAQIKSIHVTRDQFAAESANPGTTFVDVVTQPGIGPIRGGANLTFRDASMTAKSQFVKEKGAEQMKGFGGNIGGTLVKGKTSFSASVNGQRQFITPIVHAAVPGGLLADSLALRQPTNTINGSGVFDHALTRDQALKVSYNVNNIEVENFGVGNFDLPERAWAAFQHIHNLRLQEAGPIGRRTFINTRLSFQNYHLQFRPQVEAPTVQVQDAFTGGGAQQRGNQVSRTVTLASDLDHVRGIHSWRAGTQIDVMRYHSDVANNYLGTYVFSSLADYQAGRPLLYTRSVGDPLIRYTNVQGAAYVQDDLRVARGVTLSPGVRYSIQTRVPDRAAFEPRVGVTWAPWADGRTTLRASAGAFHGWLPIFVLEQTLRLDGVHQRELLITNPLYPDPGAGASLVAPNTYQLGDFRLQRNLRYSGGIDQVINPRVRFNVLYNYIHLQQQPRGRNLNPLIDGVRPNPAFANIIEAITDTEIRRHEVYVNSTIALARPSPALQRDRFNWRRLQLTAGYTLIHARNNSNGPFAVPPSGRIEDDWGPGPADTPYRFNVVATSTQLRNLTTVLSWIANSGQVYTMTTGLDDNHDGIVNDRPAGVGLRSLRGAGQSTINARFTYAFNMTPGPVVQGVPPRYRLNLFTNVQNLTNRANYLGYSGVLTSPFFMKPTFINNPRRVDVGVNVTF